MYKKILLLYKSISKTPLQTIEEFRRKNPFFTNIKLSYAGRLDPMAEGLLLVLIGDENKNRSIYENLTKTYEFSVLFGIETDSYDILGIPQIVSTKPWTDDDESLLYQYMKTYIGTYKQSYPPFSSKPVHGKPLYKWAREGKLGEINIPSHEVTITSFEKHDSCTMSIHELKNLINKQITPLTGAFRQNEIIISWEKLLKQTKTRMFPVLSFVISCSSGTYVRGVAHELGQSLKKGGITLSIKRTCIGNFTLDDISTK